MAITNRSCKVCDTEYYYCPTCPEHTNLETWHIMFHDANCKAIFNICVNDFLQKQTKQESAELLMQCDLTNLETFEEHIKEQIKEILSHVKPVEEEVVQATIIAEPTIEKEKVTVSIDTNKKTMLDTLKHKRK